MTTPSFMPGLDLSRRFYFEAVRPLLDEAVPGLAHSAARLGGGSEVLGFDTARSADHEWGSRLQLFLRPEDVTRHGTALTALLSARLPKTFYGYPTHFAATAEAGIRITQAADGPVHHRVDITDPGTWFTAQLGFDPGQGVTSLDWLATPRAAARRGHLRRCLPRRARPARPGTCGSPGTRTISGSTCSPASGSASLGRKPSSAGAAKWATNSAPPSSPRAWSAIYAALSAHGPPLPAVQQMARQRLRPHSTGDRPHARPHRGPRRHRLAHPRTAPDPRLRDRRRRPQPAPPHRPGRPHHAPTSPTRPSAHCR